MIVSRDGVTNTTRTVKIVFWPYSFLKIILKWNCVEGMNSQRVSVILGRVDEVKNIFSVRLLRLQISLISC